MPAIAVNGISKSYGRVRAVRDVSFEVEESTIFALLGRNGAGKTTVVEILEGFRRADGGTATVLGHDPSAEAAAVRPLMGLMLQEGGVYPGLRVSEALELFAAYYPNPSPAEDIVNGCGLDGLQSRRVRTLSGGEKQRLNLALALVGSPKVLFLDEPTSALDPHARLSVWSLLTALRDRGVTILMTTHQLEEAERIADRVAIIHDGRIAAESSLPLPGSSKIRFTTDQPLDASEISRASGIAIQQTSPTTFESAGPASVEDISRISAAVSGLGGVMVELQTSGEQSLESLYLSVTGP